MGIKQKTENDSMSDDTQPPESRGEFALINFIRSRAGQTPAAGSLGIGDDCALFPCGNDTIAVTTDMLIEGVHFDTSAPLRQVGWKAAAVSFSDVAAMGIRPEVLLCAAALPERFSMQQAREIILGLEDACVRYGVILAGGDTTSSDGPLSLCTTAFGRAGGLRPVLRSGARPGQVILVTGSLGGSILGKHMTFEPRVDEAVLLNQRFKLGAMIDISDGLAADLHHIIEESKTGAILEADAIPLSDAARVLAGKDGLSPLYHALHDGEDFELLFTMDAAEAQRLVEKPPFDTPVCIIGTVAESGFFIRENSSLNPLEPKGYEHFK